MRCDAFAGFLSNHSPGDTVGHVEPGYGLVTVRLNPMELRKKEYFLTDKARTRSLGQRATDEVAGKHAHTSLESSMSLHVSDQAARGQTRLKFFSPFLQAFCNCVRTGVGGRSICILTPTGQDTNFIRTNRVAAIPPFALKSGRPHSYLSVAVRAKVFQ